MNLHPQLRSNQQKHNLYSNDLSQKSGFSPLHYQDLKNHNIFQRNQNSNQFCEAQNHKQNQIRGNSGYGDSFRDIDISEANSVYRPQQIINAYSFTNHCLESQIEYFPPQVAFHNQFDEKSYQITSYTPQIDNHHFGHKTPEYRNYPQYWQSYESDSKYLSTNNYSQYHHDPYRPNYFSLHEYQNFPRIRPQSNVCPYQILQQHSVYQGRNAYQKENRSFEYINQSQMHEFQNRTPFYHQKDSSLRHDEAYYDKTNEPIQKSIKSSVQQLSQHLNDINSRLSSYINQNQKKDQTQSTNLTENIERQLQEQVQWMFQLLEQNYKLYENSQKQGQSQSRSSNSLIKNYMKHHNCQISRKSLESAQLIDYQDQIQTILKLNDLLNLKDISTGYINGREGIFSSNKNINYFIRVVIKIGEFYDLSYQILQQKDNFNISFLTSNDTDNIDRIPLLVKNILWHLQVIRILIKTYEKELNTFKIEQNPLDESNSNILQNRLKLIKSQCISSLESLEQLFMQFLQQVMVHPQQSSHGNMSSTQETQEQSVWYFYYDQLQFNNKWISLLVDTLLQFEMIIGRVSPLKYLNSQCLKRQPKLQFKKSQATNINKIQEKVRQQNCLSHNPKGKKNIKKDKEQKQHIQSNMFEDMINNFMSILSFLLYPQNKKEKDSFGSIVQLIEKPIKDLIVKSMTVFFKDILDDSSSQDQNRYNFNKHIAIHKLTNIAAFFIFKLSQCKSNDIENAKKERVSQKKSNSHNKTLNIQNKNKSVQEIEQKPYSKGALQLGQFEQLQNHDQIKCPSAQNCNQKYQTNQNSHQNSQIQLKIMQITMLVRQMTDLLVEDNNQEPINKKKNKNANTKQQKPIKLEQQPQKNEKIAEIQIPSISSTLNLLFQKIIQLKQK